MALCAAWLQQGQQRDLKGDDPLGERRGRQGGEGQGEEVEPLEGEVGPVEVESRPESGWWGVEVAVAEEGVQLEWWG